MTLQHLGRRCLLLQRLLGLVEQARVLDRDHGLVGERLQQCDLLVGERSASPREPTIVPMPRPSHIIGAFSDE